MKYFIADLHLGHNREFVYKDRGFDTIEAHDEALIANIKAKVTPNDRLYILGDVYFDKKYTDILISLNREITVVEGNHDRKLYRDSRYCERVRLCPAIMDIRVDKHNITLSHFPMMSWNQSHYGAWNLHGHVHHKVLPVLGKQFDCCPTKEHLYPWSIKELETIMANMPSNWDYIEKSERI